MKESDVQDMANFALRELGKGLPLSRYKAVNISERTMQHSCSIDPIRGKVRNPAELMENFIKPICSMLAGECEKLEFTGFAKLPVPDRPSLGLASATDDKSNVSIRLGLLYDEASATSAEHRDVSVISVGVAVE